MSPAEPPSFHIGKYSVTAEIGNGGFGRVFCAIDPTVGRTVAIKVMNAPDDEEVVKRFRSEAKTVANLHHRNIVTVYEFGEQSGIPYLVMEYLGGATLETLIRQNALSLLEKLEIMTEVAEGLRYAHERGVTHRDVKPANIMRLADGSVKIMDFGLARIAAEGGARHTSPGFVMGSLRYMAPEQFTGTADALCDIYAFGVTFYELLTGYNPFAAQDPAVSIYRITSTDTPPLRSEAADCPEPLSRVVSRLMARTRDARYSRLEDAILDLRPILVELRRRQGAVVYAQASQFLADGQLENAASTVRKVFDLDPMHPGASGLRLEIDQALQRRDAVARAAPLLEKAEWELSKRRFEEAASILKGAPTSAWSVPELQARFRQAGAQIERMRVAERHLAAARENLRQENLTVAFRAATEALSADPKSDAGQGLLEEIRARIASRDARRRFEEEIARVEGLLQAGKSGEALVALARLEAATPGAPETAALRERAQAQKKQEERARLAAGIAEVGNLLTRREFHQAIQAVERLAAEFPECAELPPLRQQAEERLADEMRKQLLEVRLEDAPAPPAPAPPAEANIREVPKEAGSQPAAGWQPAPPSTRQRPPASLWIGGAILVLVAVGAVYRATRPHAAPTIPPAPVVQAPAAVAAPQPEPTPPKSDAERPPLFPAPVESKEAAAAVPAPPACQAPKFVMDQYGDELSGELVWAGSLPGRGRLTIENRRASLGRVQGDVLPQNVPIRISVTPATVRVASAPSAANCWAAGLVLQNGGTETAEIHIKWRVFQP